MKGFTLPEIIITVSILVALAFLAIPFFSFFKNESDLNNSTEKIINILKLAQSKTLASEGAAQYGVFFSTSTFPNQYILFKGASYDTRDVSFDETYDFPKSVEVFQVDLAGQAEAVFEKVTGNSLQLGSVSFRLKEDLLKTKSVYIDKAGQVGGGAYPSAADENRLKDSRHVHFDYSRIISTSTEYLLLTFEGGATEIIQISESMVANQIFWEGEVSVGGSIQEIKIHTYRLNNPDTQFSVLRDRRYNQKSLTIDIDSSPDLDPGSLIEYSADGMLTTSTSFFVSNLQWE